MQMHDSIHHVDKKHLNENQQSKFSKYSIHKYLPMDKIRNIYIGIITESTPSIWY